MYDLVRKALETLQRRPSHFVIGARRRNWEGGSRVLLGRQAVKRNDLPLTDLLKRRAKVLMEIPKEFFTVQSMLTLRRNWHHICGLSSLTTRVVRAWKTRTFLVQRSPVANVPKNSSMFFFRAKSDLVLEFFPFTGTRFIRIVNSANGLIPSLIDFN